MYCLPSCMKVIIPYWPGNGSSTLARIWPVFLSRACSTGLPFSIDLGLAPQILGGLHQEIAHHHLNGMAGASGLGTVDALK